MKAKNAPKQLEVKVRKVALIKRLGCPKQAKLLTGVWYQKKEQKWIFQDGFSDRSYHTHGDFWEGLKILF